MTGSEFTITGLGSVRRWLDQIAIENGLAVPCDRCAGAIYPDQIHVCPDVIDVQAIDLDLPALPDGRDP